MAYGYKNLSKAQEDAIRIMKAHDNTLVKRDGFGHTKIVNFMNVVMETIC